MAYGALFTSPWFQLWDSPVEHVARILRQPFAQLRELFFSPLVARVSDRTVEAVVDEVEGAFDKAEFLDGVSVAMTAIVDQFSAGNWAGLREVCSERLVERLQIALFELEAGQGLRLSSLRVTDLSGLRLNILNLWGQDSIARFDPGWAATANPATTATSWLVATVQVSARMEAQYTPAADGGAGAVTSSKTLHRSGVWLFARGPLPRGFSSQLHLPWRVLGVA